MRLVDNMKICFVAFPLEKNLKAKEELEQKFEVRASATGAQELYRGFGFAPAGVRKAYYEQGEDAVVMWCHSIGDDGYDGLLDQLELGEGRS
jgi:hypothetical protein